VVIGVAIVVALVVNRCVVSINYGRPIWLEVTACATYIVLLAYHGFREILKIRWLGLSQRSETKAVKNRKPSKTRPPAPATDAITQKVDPQIKADQKDRTDATRR
jgi:hypothetical protein